jgi:hypothetical protein
MKSLFYIALIVSSFSLQGFGQKHLQGRWEGSLIQDGKEYILKMDINRKGHKLEAEIYCITNDTTFTRTVAKGRLYSDRSVYLEDFKIVFPDDPVEGLHFEKQFQLLYARDFNTITLNGYWQEQKNVSKDYQKIGQIRLSKIITKKRA